MATREEMEILLRDSITPGLRAIARELRELNKVAKENSSESAANIDRMKSSYGGLNDASTAALRSVTAMGAYIIGFGKSVLGIGGTIETIKRLNEGITEFATNRVHLSNFSTDTKFATRDILEMRGAMARMGIEAGTANQYIGNLSNKLQELRAFKEGSTLFQDLQKTGSKGVELGKKLLGDVKAGDFNKALDDILNVYKKQSPEMKYYLSQVLGIPQSVLEHMLDYRKLVKDVFAGDPAAAQQYLINLAEFHEKVDAEWTLFADHAVKEINKVVAKLEEKSGDPHVISKFFIEGFDEAEKSLKQDIEDVQKLINFIKGVDVQTEDVWKKMYPEGPWKAFKDTFLGGKEPPKDAKELADRLRDAVNKGRGAGETGAATFAERFDATESLKLQQDNNKFLSDIRDSLFKLLGNAAANAPTMPGGGTAPPSVGTTPDSGSRGTEQPMTESGTGDKPSLSTGAVKTSWFGSSPGWFDPSSGSQTASGRPVTEPGIALPSRAGLGKMFEVTTPDGRKFILPQTDLGPAKWTGRGLDITSAAATRMGYTAKTFPTDAPFKVRRISDEEAEQYNQDQRRKRVDDAQHGAAAKGSATVNVEFGGGPMKPDPMTETSMGGGPFKDVRIGREPQSPKAGDPSTLNERWYFQ
jgi:hypothetical protein